MGFSFCAKILRQGCVSHRVYGWLLKLGLIEDVALASVSHRVYGWLLKQGGRRQHPLLGVSHRVYGWLLKRRTRRLRPPGRVSHRVYGWLLKQEVLAVVAQPHTSHRANRWLLKLEVGVRRAAHRHKPPRKQVVTETMGWFPDRVCPHKPPCKQVVTETSETPRLRVIGASHRVDGWLLKRRSQSLALRANPYLSYRQGSRIARRCGTAIHPLPTSPLSGGGGV